MIGGAKSMIAGCIERMRTVGCDGCERRDACSHLFAELFGMVPKGRREPPPATRGEAGPRDVAGTLFRTFFGEVAKTIERRMESARQEAASRAAVAPMRDENGDRAKRATRASAQSDPGPVTCEIEGHLEPLLATGPIGIAAVARALGYSRQTLYRRLKAEGVTYEDVLDKLRRRLAIRFIRDEGLSVKDAAYRLGFSDPAAFSRAYKRWTGASPNASRH